MSIAQKKSRSSLALLLGSLITLVLLILTTSVQAHIEADMPDPIAEVEYQMMLDFEPDDMVTRYKLAMVYFRLNKLAKAEAELQQVLKSKPNYFHGLEGLAILRIKQQDYPAAIQALEKALTSDLVESGTYYYLGRARQGLGDLKGATEAFSQGRTICAKEDEAKRAFTPGQFDDALTALKK